MATPSWHSVWRYLWRFVWAAALCIVTCIAAMQTSARSEEPASKARPPADENGPHAAQRKLLREQMTARIGKVKVASVDTPEQPSALVPEPLMSYRDEPLSINGATLWAWAQPKQGRPVAVCKIEHYDMTRRAVRGEWLYCFVSLSGERIRADWPDGHQWTARLPGVSFHDIPNAPRPGESSAARVRQMKDLSRRFTASFEFGKGTHEELRLLTQPVYLYSDADRGIMEGAVFTAAANGTNPTALFLIELQKERDRQLWKFAVAAMTDASVVVNWDGKEVWSKPALHAPGKDFETWTYFFEQQQVE
jgi:hypothetical protein